MGGLSSGGKLIIKAPWTQEQVDALNKCQKTGVFHPFTCGACRDADPVLIDDHLLVATQRGWRCATCDYTQNWAHSFMAEEWKGYEL